MSRLLRKQNLRLRIQSGLTLIELAVVLAILVALSTLMIPYVSNYIGQAEVATSNYNASAVLSAFSISQVSCHPH